MVAKSDNQNESKIDYHCYEGPFWEAVFETNLAFSVL
jgi:hypothetical protein